MARVNNNSQMDLNKTVVGNQIENTARVFYTSQMEADKRVLL